MLLALCMLVASGRLVPRLVLRQHLTLSDCLLIASILDAIGLFVTDTLTYELGGMSEKETAAPDSQLIALKKVSMPVCQRNGYQQADSCANRYNLPAMPFTTLVSTGQS